MSRAKLALITTLTERFPKAFPADPQAIKPLKIGIDADIRKACPELNEKLLRQVLAGHTQRYSYLKALARGGLRIDLQGNPVETITAEACAQAKERLNKRLEPESKAVQPKAKQRPVAPLSQPSSPIIRATITTRTGRPVLTLKAKR
jgi:sRNA-binding protein